METQRHNRPVWNDLHPLVYAMACALVLLFIATIWAVFSGWAYMRLVLWVVTGFFLMVMAIPLAMRLTWSSHREGDPPPVERVGLREWMSGQLDTAQGRRKASDATIEMLLPIAAVAFGMIALGIVFVVSVPPGAWQ